MLRGLMRDVPLNISAAIEYGAELAEYALPEGK